MSFDHRTALETLEHRIRTMLPEEYQDSYQDVQPVSMGSAGLKYDSDGKVAWNEMWDTFCDLAMAGGPPHKGTLLEPGAQAEVEAQPERYQEVAAEICRGVMMATGLPADPSPHPGWIRVECLTEGMAGWLLRAIVMENVAARREGLMLDLPAAPHFRIEKEIKNVITVIAKTSHYWLGHMPRLQQRAITGLISEMSQESPLIEPSPEPARATDAAPAPAPAPDAAPSHEDRRTDGGDDQTRRAKIAAAIQRDTGLRPSIDGYAGWIGMECASVGAAIWMMRALVVNNVLSRREGTTLFAPIDAAHDPTGALVVNAVTRVYRLATVKGLC
jgi:sirohydrochlorin cobaltochelatase